MPRSWNPSETWSAIETPADLDWGLARSMANEVAIDFPSMDGPLARMLAGFGDPVEPSSHVERVSLSSRQAIAGTRLPLEVPLQRTCPMCGGRGETWSDACSPCHGSGSAIERHPLVVTIPAGVRHGARFTFSLSHPRGRRAHVEVHVAVR
jgi:hypothetical protein